MRPVDARLLTLLPEARRPVLALGALGVLQGAAAIGTAFAISALVVALVAGAPLTWPVLALAAVFTLRAALAAAGETTAAKAATRVSSGLRSRLIATWLTLPAERRPEASRALTLATQGTASVEPYVARFLPALVSACVLPAMAIAVMAVVDWPSAVIVLLTVPLLPVFAALIGRTTAEATARRWSALAGLSGHFLDVMRGLPTLVSYGRAGRQAETIDQVSQRHRRATVATLRLAFLSSAALELLATISVALVAVGVGLRLAGGSMALPTGLTAILLAPEAYWPIRRVGAEFHSAADGAGALAGAFDELEPRQAEDPESTPDPGDRTGVRVVDLTYRHPGSAHPAIEGLTLVAGRGLTVVTGPSGAGKSTLLELLAGLREPTTGTVQAPPAHLVTQQPFLAAGTVRDNLRLGSVVGQDDRRLWAALRDVGLDGLVAGLPHGLSTRIGDDGFGLSAGQRARLALARVLLSDAPLVLLDEPTAHLDRASAELAHTVVRRLAGSRVVVAVSHRPELVAQADQHVRLRAARLPASA
jgi:ATP-binding cassette, subfamily C, bacterial CydD